MLRRYRYSYQTVVRFEKMVSDHHFSLRATPRICSQQRSVEQRLYLLSGCEFKEAKDAFGNDIRYGSMRERHDMFVISSCGVVDCTTYKIEDQSPHPIFRSQSHMTHIDHDMIRFGEGVSREGSPLDQAIALSEMIHTKMSYTPGVTSTETKATEFFHLGEGVCQDFAHLLLSLCRERGLLARYVVGFVIGTGETHAWVEIYCDGAWYGVDPTHNLLIDYGYIKIAHGRDANDCSVTRGVHRGDPLHRTTVSVSVEEVIF